MAKETSKTNVFSALATKDMGSDPVRFETAPLRDLIQRREVISEIAESAAAMASAFNDTVLHLGEQVRPLGLAAYQLAKASAEHDDKLRSAIAPVVDFYATPARVGARTRAAKKNRE